MGWGLWLLAGVALSGHNWVSFENASEQDWTLCLDTVSTGLVLRRVLPDGATLDLKVPSHEVWRSGVHLGDLDLLAKCSAQRYQIRLAAKAVVHLGTEDQVVRTVAYLSLMDHTGRTGPEAFVAIQYVAGHGPFPGEEQPDAVPLSPMLELPHVHEGVPDYLCSQKATLGQTERKFP